MTEKRKETYEDPPIFHDYCGTRYELKHVVTKYDPWTGQPRTEKRLYCPHCKWDFWWNGSWWSIL